MSPSFRPDISSLEAVHGPRVFLRPYRLDDAEQLFAAISSSRAHLDSWVEWTKWHTSIEESRQFCQACEWDWSRRAELTMGIFDATTGRLLGGTGFHAPDWKLRGFEVGYWLRAGETGKGYATETTQLLTARAFDQMNARRVELRCDARNIPSQRIAERCGYVLEGRLRNAGLTPAGELRDTLVYALTPEDWARLRSGPGLSE